MLSKGTWYPNSTYLFILLWMSIFHILKSHCELAVFVLCLYLFNFRPFSCLIVGTLYIWRKWDAFQIFSQCVFEFVLLSSSCLVFNYYTVKLYPYFCCLCLVGFISYWDRLFLLWDHKKKIPPCFLLLLVCLFSCLQIFELSGIYLNVRFLFFNLHANSSCEGLLGI